MVLRMQWTLWVCLSSITILIFSLQVNVDLDGTPIIASLRKLRQKEQRQREVWSTQLVQGQFEPRSEILSQNAEGWGRVLGLCAQGPMFDTQHHRKQREKPEPMRDLDSTLGKEDPQP